MTTKAYEQMVDAMPLGIERAMLRIMDFHTGKAQAIGRGRLVRDLEALGIDAGERQARQCIHDLRRAGHLICSMPGEDGGYYLAASLAEFREFCERELHPKAMDLLETETAMKAAARAQFGDAVQTGLF
jgi:hypothetical protein